MHCGALHLTKRSKGKSVFCVSMAGIALYRHGYVKYSGGKVKYCFAMAVFIVVVRRQSTAEFGTEYKILERMKMEKLEISQENLGTLLLCAIRYCQGRMSYMPSKVQGIGTMYLGKVSDDDLTVMIEDCEFQETMDLYGDKKIDKPGWIKWKKDLLNEHRRRKDERTVG